jgi:hypothetical protein
MLGARRIFDLVRYGTRRHTLRRGEHNQRTGRIQIGRSVRPRKNFRFRVLNLKASLPELTPNHLGRISVAPCIAQKYFAGFSTHSDLPPVYFPRHHRRHLRQPYFDEPLLDSGATCKMDDGFGKVLKSNKTIQERNV